VRCKDRSGESRVLVEPHRGGIPLAPGASPVRCGFKMEPRRGDRSHHSWAFGERAQVGVSQVRQFTEGTLYFFFDPL